MRTQVDSLPRPPDDRFLCQKPLERRHRYSLQPSRSKVGSCRLDPVHCSFADRSGTDMELNKTGSPDDVSDICISVSAFDGFT